MSEIGKNTHEHDPQPVDRATQRHGLRRVWSLAKVAGLAGLTALGACAQIPSKQDSFPFTHTREAPPSEAWKPLTPEQHASLGYQTNNITWTFIDRDYVMAQRTLHPDQQPTREGLAAGYMRALTHGKGITMPDIMAHQWAGSVVNIMAEQNNGANASNGTGWFVATGADRGVIVTNKHVAAGVDRTGSSPKANNTAKTFIIARGMAGENYFIERVILDPKQDLALLITREKPKHAISLASHAAVDDGSVISLGFGQELTARPNDRPLSLQFGSKISGNRYALTNHAGDSGGPIMDATGNVVGINTSAPARPGDRTGLTFTIKDTVETQAVSSKIIGDFLKQNGLMPVTQAPSGKIIFPEKRTR